VVKAAGSQAEVFGTTGSAQPFGDDVKVLLARLMPDQRQDHARRLLAIFVDVSGYPARV